MIIKIINNNVIYIIVKMAKLYAKQICHFND